MQFEVLYLLTVGLVIPHVAELYNRIDLTLELNILISVFSLIRFDFQILLMKGNACFFYSSFSVFFCASFLSC